MKVKREIDIVMDATLKYIQANNWAGACFASSAINCILLSEFGVSSTATLGVFHANVLNEHDQHQHICFDHGWIEIGGRIFDVAITLGKEVNFGPNLLDARGIRGQYGTHFVYAKNESVEPDIKARLVPFTSFMQESPFFDKSITYWDVCTIIGKSLGLNLAKESISDKYKNTKWVYV